MTHSHHQNIKFNLAQEPFVRKKLFHVEEIKESEGKVSDSKTEAVAGSSDLFPRKSSQQDQTTTPLHRSSPRRNAFQSVSSLFSKSDSLRRNALESCQSKKLSKFVSQGMVINEEKPLSSARGSLSTSRSAVNVSLTLCMEEEDQGTVRPEDELLRQICIRAITQLQPTSLFGCPNQKIKKFITERVGAALKKGEREGVFEKFSETGLPPVLSATTPLLPLFHSHKTQVL